MLKLTDNGRVSRLPMIGSERCAQALARLQEVSPSWTQRGRAFYTLGAATYLDLCQGDGARYETVRTAADPVIERTFGPLLDEIRLKLEGLLEAPCRFDPRLAFPGFHIFLSRSLDSRLRDNLHLDLQHAYHAGTGFTVNTPSFTFTLPLELPSAGGGIELCLRSGSTKRGELVEHEYHVGELFFHSGRALHRRIHRPATPKCRRITLQGHGVLEDGQWILYW